MTAERELRCESVHAIAAHAGTQTCGSTTHVPFHFLKKGLVLNAAKMCEMPARGHESAMQEHGKKT
jgi:hypothetical protein